MDPIIYGIIYALLHAYREVFIHTYAVFSFKLPPNITFNNISVAQCLFYIHLVLKFLKLIFMSGMSGPFPPEINNILADKSMYKES